MEDDSEEFVITVDAGYLPDITTMDKFTIHSYATKFRDIPKIDVLLSYMVDIVGEPVVEDIYRKLMGLKDVLPVVDKKDMFSYPLRDGTAINKQNGKKMHLRYDTPLQVTGVETPFKIEQFKSTRDIRRFIIRFIDNKIINRRLCVENIRSSKDINVSRVDIILETLYIDSRLILEVLSDLYSTGVYPVGINSHYDEILNAGILDVPSRHLSLAELTRSHKEKYQMNYSKLLEVAVYNTLRNFSRDKFTDKKIQKFIKEYIDRLYGANEVITSCDHNVILKELLTSTKSNLVRKYLKMLESFYDKKINMNMFIPCSNCDVTIMCPHQLVLLKSYDDTEFNQKIKMEKFLTYEKQRSVATCRVCKTEIFSYTNTDSMEFYDVNNYGHREFSDDELYKNIIKYTTLLVRLDSVVINDKFISNKDIIDMAAPTIYQLANTELQVYLKNNIISSSFYNVVSATVALVYSASLLNFIAEKMTVKNKSIYLIKIKGTMEDIISNIYDQYISTVEDAPEIEYSSIIISAKKNIASNKAAVDRRIRTINVTKVTNSMKKRMVSWNYAIPDKRILIKLGFKYDINPDVFITLLDRLPDGYINELMKKEDIKDDMSNLYFMVPKDHRSSNPVIVEDKKIIAGDAIPPYHVTYDNKGEMHDFRYDSKSGEIKCVVCGWKFKDLDSHSRDDVNIQYLVKKFDAFKIFTRECPVSKIHSYKKGDTCVNCGFRESWDKTSDVYSNYFRKYEKVITPRMEETEKPSIQSKVSFDYQEMITKKIGENDNYSSDLFSMVKGDKKLIRILEKLMSMTENYNDILLMIIRLIKRILFFNPDSLTKNDAIEEVHDNIGKKRINQMKDGINQHLDYRKIITDINSIRISDAEELYSMYLRNIISKILFKANEVSPLLFGYVVTEVVYVREKLEKMRNNAETNAIGINHERLEDVMDMQTITETPEPGTMAEQEEDGQFAEEEEMDFENGRFLAGLSRHDE